MKKSLPILGTSSTSPLDKGGTVEIEPQPMMSRTYVQYIEQSY